MSKASRSASSLSSLRNEPSRSAARGDQAARTESRNLATSSSRLLRASNRSRPKRMMPSTMVRSGREGRAEPLVIRRAVQPAVRIVLWRSWTNFLNSRSDPAESSTATA